MQTFCQAYVHMTCWESGADMFVRLENRIQADSEDFLDYCLACRASLEGIGSSVRSLWLRGKPRGSKYPIIKSLGFG